MKKVLEKIKKTNYRISPSLEKKILNKSGEMWFKYLFTKIETLKITPIELIDYGN